MQRLVEVVQRRARERAQRFVGRTLEVLVEGASRTDPSRLRGRTRHNKVVNFAGLAQPGEYVDVEIHAATSQTLLGEQARLLAARARRPLQNHACPRGRGGLVGNRVADANLVGPSAPAPFRGWHAPCR